LSADFIGRQKIGQFLYVTRSILSADIIGGYYRPIISAINLAAELGSNFAEKIG